MINLVYKNILLYMLLFVLTACGGDEGIVNGSQQIDETSPNEAGSLTIGKSNYDATCSECHGGSGDNVFRPLNIDNCLVADCSNIDALATYIDEFMPVATPQSCTFDGVDSCAATTAAYIINGFSTETTGETTELTEISAPLEPADENVQTPLARLTNDEYINSVRVLLSLTDDSPQVNAAKTSLASEAIVNGLASDTVTQIFTQLTVSGYSTMALAASDDFLKDVTSRDELGLLLDCTALVENYNPNNQLGTCTQQFASNLITKAYRRSSNDEDTANIAELLDGLTENHQVANIELWSIEFFKEYIQSILQFITLSPEFLLIVESGNADTDNSNGPSKRLSDHEIATRLSLFLAGTLPDEALLAAAGAGLLGDEEVRLQHADRMMNSDIGINQFTSLMSNWLGINESIAESASLIPANEFITNWFVNEGLFSDLYQAPITVKHLDGIETTEPLGVLGLQAFVASHTSYPTPSFITRGVFVVERLLCEALPEDLPDGALDAGALTPLEVFEGHAQQPCATCHKVFDNYGAAFQRFDAETSLYNPAFQDFGSSFNLYEIGDLSTSVTGVGDLGNSLASSERATSCMAELWYRHSMRRDIDAQGKDVYEVQTLVDSWAESGDKSMKALLRSIVASDSFITLYL